MALLLIYFTRGVRLQIYFLDELILQEFGIISRIECLVLMCCIRRVLRLILSCRHSHKSYGRPLSHPVTLVRGLSAH